MSLPNLVCLPIDVPNVDVYNSSTPSSVHMREHTGNARHIIEVQRRAAAIRFEKVKRALADRLREASHLYSLRAPGDNDLDAHRFEYRCTLHVAAIQNRRHWPADDAGRRRFETFPAVILTTTIEGSMTRLLRRDRETGRSVGSLVSALTQAAARAVGLFDKGPDVGSWRQTSSGGWSYEASLIIPMDGTSPTPNRHFPYDQLASISTRRGLPHDSLHRDIFGDESDDGLAEDAPHVQDAVRHLAHLLSLPADPPTYTQTFGAETGDRSTTPNTSRGWGLLYEIVAAS